MWIGVCLTIVLELTPRNMHTTSIAIYMFIITNIGELLGCSLGTVLVLR